MVRYTIRDNRNVGSRRRPRHEMMTGLVRNLRTALERVAKLNVREADKERFSLDSYELVEVIRDGAIVETPSVWVHLMKE